MMRAAVAATAVAAAVLATSRPADACGGYIANNVGLRLNDALELVVVREGTRTFVSVRNRYRGPVEAFALLVPVPQVLKPDDVRTLDPSVFDWIADVSAPQLYFLREDDPCRKPSKGEDGTGAPGGGMGSGRGVQVEAAFQVGEYDVEVLSATDATGLDTWLREHQYQIPDTMAPLLRPYVDGGSKFFVAKVDPARVNFVDGAAVLSPLRFAYDADEVSLPLRLSAANSPGTQDVLVHTIARSRLDAANRPQMMIPSGLEMRPGASFAEFYEALFAEVIERQPDAAVTEYVGHARKYDDRVTGGLTALGVDPAAATADNIEQWIITRLHLRIGKGGRHEDLVLRDAADVDFTAEYTTRRPWTGEARCARPKWGSWDRDHAGGAEPVAFGKDIGKGPELAKLVAQDVPSLNVVAEYRPPTRPRGGGGNSGGCCDSGGAPRSTALLVLLVLVAVRWRR